MKILYVKNNSERAKEFQLKTIIYEQDGVKYVKKQAIVPEAIKHLKKMKVNYQKLSDSIIDPKIKLAKIVNEDKDSLTFEFIDGISLENKFNDALAINKEASYEIIDEYMELLRSGFKTIEFDSTTVLTDEYRDIFSNLDFTLLDKQLCFNGISNIDLIFSNIIYKSDSIYLIDYEWTYLMNIPIDYIAYRSIHMLPSISNDLMSKHNLNLSTYSTMEDSFVNKHVISNGFHSYQSNYIKANSLTIQKIEQLNEEINNKNLYLQELLTTIDTIDKNLSYARSIVELRDQQLIDMTLKKRLQRVLKKMIPNKLLYIFENETNTKNNELIK